LTLPIIVFFFSPQFPTTLPTSWILCAGLPFPPPLSSLVDPRVLIFSPSGTVCTPLAEVVFNQFLATSFVLLQTPSGIPQKESMPFFRCQFSSHKKRSRSFPPPEVFGVAFLSTKFPLSRRVCYVLFPPFPPIFEVPKKPVVGKFPSFFTTSTTFFGVCPLSYRCWPPYPTFTVSFGGIFNTPFLILFFPASDRLWTSHNFFQFPLTPPCLRALGGQPPLLSGVPPDSGDSTQHFGTRFFLVMRSSCFSPLTHTPPLWDCNHSFCFSVFFPKSFFFHLLPFPPFVCKDVTLYYLKCPWVLYTFFFLQRFI